MYLHVFILSTLTTCIYSQLTWHKLPQTAISPPPRQDAGMGYDDTRKQLVLFGGKTKDDIFADTWIYDVTKDSWREVAVGVNPVPHKRHSFVCGVSGDYFYIATGQGENLYYYNDIWRFNLATEKWERLPDQQKPEYYTDQQWTAHTQARGVLVPAYRYGAAGGIYPNATRFYISLGFSKSSHGDTLSYSTTDMAWYLDYASGNPYNPSYPHGRYMHSGVMMSPNELLIYGGCLSGGGTAGPCPSNDAWVFNTKRKDWQETDSCATPRFQASLAMLPNKGGQRRAILYGGEEKWRFQVLKTVEAPANQISVFNPETLEWTIREAGGNNIPVKRSSASMVTGTDGVYMFGGLDIKGNILMNDLYKLTGDASTADRAKVQMQCRPTTFTLVMLHGILMTLAFGFFLPWGAFIARFGKQKPPLWFHMHRLFQVFGLLVAIAGFIVAVISVTSGHFSYVHAIVGIIAMVLALQQPFNGLLRPKAAQEGDPKTVARLLWEGFHYLAGHVTIMLGLVNISLGVFLALSMTLIWALWFAYLCLYVVIWVAANLNRQCSTRKVSEPLISQNKYVVRTRSGTLFMDKNTVPPHHLYDNSAMESEG